MTFAYFEHGVFAGTREVQLAEYNGIYPFMPHLAYFCPFCGELWGTATQLEETQYSFHGWPAWGIEKRPCVKHGDGQFLYAQPLEGVSKELLTRELLALMETYNGKN